MPSLNTAILALFVVMLPQPQPTGLAAQQGVILAGQEMGGWFQTPSGGCPLLDSNGQPMSQPVGTLCFCGSDAGQVII